MVALLFVFVPILVLEWSEGPSPAFAGILARLRHECDPANPDADYYWTQSSMPTERKREAIIEDCRRMGGKLLPEVRREMVRETDDEVRGMLIVIAAALGDDASVEQASRQMAWSEYPAVRISAAKTLRRLRDRRAIDWFLTALQDHHFVVNGACGTLREKFYPVRNIAQMALQEVMAERYPGDDEVQRMSRSLNGGPLDESALDRARFLEALMLKAVK
jgi:HEAT repeat protein